MNVRETCEIRYYIVIVSYPFEIAAVSETIVPFGSTITMKSFAATAAFPVIGTLAVKDELSFDIVGATAACCDVTVTPPAATKARSVCAL